MTFAVNGDPLTIGALILDQIGSLHITNTMTTSLIDDVFLIALCIAASRFTVYRPGKFQLFIEDLLTMVTSFIEQIVGNKKAAWKIMPIVSTLIIFILLSNLLMIFMPVLSGLTYNGITMFRAHTNDINTTLALSFSMVVLTHLYSVQTIGILRHVDKFFRVGTFFAAIINSFKDVIKSNGESAITLGVIFKAILGGFGAGMMALIDVFVGILDIVSEFAKVVSLSLRLFGNMFAGDLLVSVLMGLFAIGLPLPMMLLSLMSGSIQAIVFGALVSGSLGQIAVDSVENKTNFKT